ncbi:hypothetical protein N7462_004106 [Penicillium macrosclerotiorum]|uniref:uncharacterized protein n=1 Tax=Penicillium macrosclerotiorum TaxID=303699 RepID=UPI0025488C4B|nr:uncharacterized protein N7462_004106 [Penicillium macrosclerotiorum]KAJ5689714.1 hypothetical protein N7462_004106 [Penicillium macrosclerotiorum]
MPYPVMGSSQDVPNAFLPEEHVTVIEVTGLFGQSTTCIVESSQSYHDAVRALRAKLSTTGYSFEMMPAIMCLTLVELMLPNSIVALTAHVQAIGALFRAYGPESLVSGVPHKLFLGFRPLLITEAIRSRRLTFLALPSWITTPFSISEQTPIQDLFTHVVNLPFFLQQSDRLFELSSQTCFSDIQPALERIIEVLVCLSNWEKRSRQGPDTLFPWPTSSELGTVMSSGYSKAPIQFSHISVANVLTHLWAFRIVCLMEIDRIVSNFPDMSQTLHETIDRVVVVENVGNEIDGLAKLICFSMDYLLRDEMKLFGPASALFPAEVAYKWFQTNKKRYQDGNKCLENIVHRLVQKGLRSASMFICGESSR